MIYQYNIKRIIILTISLFLFYIEYIGQIVCCFLKINTASRCVIIYYHNIKNEEKKRFAQQVKNILKNCKVIGISTYQKIEKINNNYVIITFDDAFKNLVKNAIPELNKLNLPFTIFIPSGYLGSKAKWVQNYDIGNIYDVMSESDICSLSNNKNITFGSHTVTHPKLTQLTNEDISFELKQSKIELERLTNRTIDIISFPYGEHNQKVVQMAKENGYSNVYSITPKLRSISKNEYNVGRVEVNADDWNIEYKLKIIGCYRWVAIAINIKRSIYKFKNKLIG